MEDIDFNDDFSSLSKIKRCDMALCFTDIKDQLKSYSNRPDNYRKHDTPSFRRYTMTENNILKI